MRDKTSIARRLPAHVSARPTRGRSLPHQPRDLLIQFLNAFCPVASVVKRRVADGVVKTVVRKRWVDGSVPYDAIATFPYGVRQTLDPSGSYYRSGLPLPFEAPRIGS